MYKKVNEQYILGNTRVAAVKKICYNVTMIEAGGQDYVRNNSARRGDFGSIIFNKLLSNKKFQTVFCVSGDG